MTGDIKNFIHLVNDRVILSCGLGNEQDKSFGDFGEVTDAKQGAEMLDEGLDILDELMSGQPVSYQSRERQTRH